MTELIVIGMDEAGNLAIKSCVDLTAALGMIEQAKFALLTQQQRQPAKKIVQPPVGRLVV